jgi:DNA-binding SARP family transcriptional activator
MMHDHLSATGHSTRPGRLAELSLFGAFRLAIDGHPIDVPQGSQRVLAYVGTAGGLAPRKQVQSQLWPGRDGARSSANLRSAVWRIPPEARWVVELRADSVHLGDGVRCDVSDATDRYAGDPDSELPSPLDLTPLLHDLLPAWYEDWVLVERERLRLVRMDLLERLAVTLTEKGRTAEALEAALAAVLAEPLREVAQRALVKVHLAQGNTVEALDQYERYRRQLHEALGIEPSPSFRRLLADATER